MRRALTFLLLALIGCSGSPTQPKPPDGTWAVVEKNLPGALYSVHALAADDVWVAGTDPGTGPLVLHFDGKVWHQVATGATGSLRWVFGFSGGPLFIAGDSGTILRSTDGKTFEKMTTPGTHTIWGIWGAAPNDMWAVGGEPDGGAFAWRYDGNQWTDAPGFPADVTGNGAAYKVWGRGSSDVFIVGTSGLMLHWNGTALVREDTGVNATLFTVNGGPDGVLAVGGFASGVVVESSGDGTWHASSVPTNGGLIGVCVAPSGTYLCGEQAALLQQKSDGTWLRTPGASLQSHDLHAINVDPTGGVWAVGGDLDGGSDGVLLHFGAEVPTTIDAG